MGTPLANGCTVELIGTCSSAEPALWRSDYEAGGFYWIDCADRLNSVLSFVRRDLESSGELAVVLNLTPVPHHRYRVGLPRPGGWREALNSDAAVYGGSNAGNAGRVVAEPFACHNQPCSAEMTLPPLSVLVLQPEG